MKIFKKALKWIGAILCLMVLAGIIYIYNSGPTLPSDTESIVEEVIHDSVPELITGQTGFAKHQGLDIWYESKVATDSSKGAILLIMGISNDALGWPPNFIQFFVDAGYQVIRYDHRGTGWSDWVSNWDNKTPYSLADMAGDGIAILDTLGIQKAHIVGASMGGMIAQELVLQYPDRVSSLTSIMSSANVFDQDVPPISSTTAFELIKVALKYGLIGGEQNMIKLHLASRMILMGEASQVLDTKGISEQVLYNLRKRAGYNSKVSAQHQAAVMQSGSRYKRLPQITVSTLVIHGKSDPFIPIEHGKKCVSLIHDADSLWVDNMGHDIPDQYIEPIAAKIISNFGRR